MSEDKKTAEKTRGKVSEKKSKVSVESENLTSAEKKETIEIPVGNYLNKIRENPWVASTFALGVLLILALVFGVAGGAGAVNIQSEGAVSENVVEFLNSQVEGGDVTLESITLGEGYYDMIVSYQGERIPLQVTLDGKNLISGLVPIGSTPSLGGTNPGTTPGANPGDPVEVNIEGAYSKGNENAPVTIVEFSDFECPFCGRFYTETLPSIESEYIDTGKVKLVYMHFPLSFHPNAQKAAEASECAGEQGKFWEMHDKIFENQASLSTSNYKMWAKEFGLSSSFDSCLDSGKYADKVQEQLEYGTSLGITGTPGFIINGKLVSGAQPFSVFEQIIEAELAA